MNFTEKYKPKSLKEVYGQDLGKLKRAIVKKKPILIYGNSPIFATPMRNGFYAREIYFSYFTQIKLV